MGTAASQAGEGAALVAALRAGDACRARSLVLAGAALWGGHPPRIRAALAAREYGCARSLLEDAALARTPQGSRAALEELAEPLLAEIADNLLQDCGPGSGIPWDPGFRVAAASGCAAALVRSGVSPDGWGAGTAPLLRAAAADNAAGAAMLLACGADPDAADPADGARALHRAVDSLSVGLLHALLLAGADSRAHDAQGQGAFERARVAVLLSAGDAPRVARARFAARLLRAAASAPPRGYGAVAAEFLRDPDENAGEALGPNGFLALEMRQAEQFLRMARAAAGALGRR